MTRVSILVGLVALILLSALMPAATFAAALPTEQPTHATVVLNQADAGGGVGAKIDGFSTQLKTIARPLGGLALVLIAISFIAAPAFKNWAEENKRQFGLMILGFILLGAAGDIVDMLAG